MTLYLPCLCPVLLGVLRECSHCMQTYLKLYVIVPGVIVPVLLQLDDVWFGVGGAAATLLAFSALYLAARELPPWMLRAVQVVAVLLVAVEAVGLAYALRA